MKETLRKAVKWLRTSASIWLVLSAVGFGINWLPIEILPGVHLLFGSTMGILAGLRFGPAAGCAVGLIAGLPTMWLWNEPVPLGAAVYALEGLWVGFATRQRKRGPLTAALSYWVILGSWLVLLINLLLLRTPVVPAFIIQARSVINGMLSGLIVEAGVLMYRFFRKRRQDETATARVSLESLVMVVFVTVISLPLLYVSTSNARDLSERTRSEMAASSTRAVSSVASEINGLLENYRRGVAMAASAVTWDLGKNDDEGVRRTLRAVRNQYPEFASLYVADVRAKAIAHDPPTDSGGQPLVGLEYSDRRYYRDLLATRKTVYSGVYQARGGMTGPAVAIGEPLLDQNGDFNGFVLGRFALKSFEEIVRPYQREEETIVVTDSEGNLVADSSLDPGSYKTVRTLVGRADFEVVRNRRDGIFEYPALESEQSGPGASTANRQHLTLKTVPLTNWKIWSRQSLAPLRTQLEQRYLRQIMVLMMTLLIAFLLGKVVARLLIRPVTALQLNAETLSAGNLSARPSPRSFLTAEIDSLYHSFARMAENIETSWSRQQELLREVSIAKGEWESTFNAMADSVAITDSEDRLIRANRAFYNLLSLEPYTGVGEPLTQVAHPSGNWERCDVCRVRRLGRQAYVVSAPPGNQAGRDLAVRVDPVYTADGERIGMVQVVRDLTEIRKAEQEAARADALLRNLVDAAYDAVFATDLEGRFLWANRRAEDLFGVDGQSLDGASFFRAIHVDDVERVRANFRAAANGEAQEYEVRYLTLDDVRQVLVTNSPVYANGEVITLLGIARDITTDRLVAERTSRNDKLRALGQLASGVAHNFNNSLTAVIGYTQMALNKVRDPVLTRHLKTVETAALDAAKMVQRIQNFARQRQDEAMAPSDLNQILRDALDLTRSRWRDDARADGLEYDVLFRPTDRAIISCDQSAMREVFVNLIINALDAMPKGGRLTITTANEADSAIMTFSDTGCGMTEEIRQRIFEPFFTTKGTRGYGMGLSVTYGIIERHGGEIQVSSEPGQGSTFTIRLPVKREVTGDRGDDGAQFGKWNARTASVLVVDDEAPIRALLADLLRARGHKVLMAEDGLAGLRAVEGSRFDLVITDISMPGVDGWAVVTEVRRRWPDTKLVIVTGYGGLVDQVVRGDESDLVDALISKPFNLAEIDSTINDLLLDAQRTRPN
ncbi:MAG TPA: ATP-binding protein [Blastocatellia bacterium]|nr:ATP-binding protein [Blastocatellia bacterium]